MEQYQVTGMSCAACSIRVEKAVSGVPGVTSCAVSLLTNSMGVEGTAAAADVIRAVEAAGYGASLKGANTQASSGAAPSWADAEALKDHETPKLKRRLLFWKSMKTGSSGAIRTTKSIPRSRCRSALIYPTACL